MTTNDLLSAVKDGRGSAVLWKRVVAQAVGREVVPSYHWVDIIEEDSGELLKFDEELAFPPDGEEPVYRVIFNTVPEIPSWCVSSEILRVQLDRTDRRQVLRFFELHGLPHADRSFDEYIDEHMILVAADSHGAEKTLGGLPGKHRFFSDKNLMLLLIKDHFHAITYASESLKGNLGFVREVMRMYDSIGRDRILAYASESVRNQILGLGGSGTRKRARPPTDTDD